MSSKRYCRSCGYQTLNGDEPTGDICPVCAWIDEATEVEGSANPPLMTAQECMASFGAVDECYTSIVRKPNANEPRNPAWKLESEVFEEQRAVLLAHIEFAFRNVFRHDGLSLDEAEDLDGYEQPAADRKPDDTKPWQDVSDESLDYFQAMPFLDAKGMRYYLPAFMHWIVRESEDNSAFSSDQFLWALGDMRQFTFLQKDMEAERRKPSGASPLDVGQLSTGGSEKSSNAVDCTPEGMRPFRYNSSSKLATPGEQRHCVISFLRFLCRFEHLGFQDDARAALKVWGD